MPSYGASQGALEVKNLSDSAGDVRDMGLIPELGRSPGGGHDNPLQYPCLENSHGALWATVHGIIQARILEWVAMPSSRGSSQLRD